MESLEPSPILVAPLGVDAMETTAAIAVPGFAVSPLEVPALAIALLDLPAIGDQVQLRRENPMTVRALVIDRYSQPRLRR